MPFVRLSPKHNTVALAPLPPKAWLDAQKALEAPPHLAADGDNALSGAVVCLACRSTGADGGLSPRLLVAAIAEDPVLRIAAVGEVVSTVGLDARGDAAAETGVAGFTENPAALPPLSSTPGCRGASAVAACVGDEASSDDGVDAGTLAATGVVAATGAAAAEASRAAGEAAKGSVGVGAAVAAAASTPTGVAADDADHVDTRPRLDTVVTDEARAGAAADTRGVGSATGAVVAAAASAGALRP